MTTRVCEFEEYVLMRTSQEALPILKDQRELLKSLVEEKMASQRQYDLVLKRLDQLTVARDDSSLATASKETAVTTNSSVTLVSTTSSMSEKQNLLEKESLLPSLPAHLHYRAEEIFDHCRLINTVLQEVNHAQYKIDLGIRYRTQQLILDSHYDEWVPHLGDPRYTLHQQNRYDFLEKCPELVSLLELSNEAQ